MEDYPPRPVLKIRTPPPSPEEDMERGEYVIGAYGSFFPPRPTKSASDSEATFTGIFLFSVLMGLTTLYAGVAGHSELLTIVGALILIASAWMLTILGECTCRCQKKSSVAVQREKLARWRGSWISS